MVLCNGRLYTAPLLEPETERPLTIEEYQTMLERVWELATPEPGPGLAALTTDNMTRWAEVGDGGQGDGYGCTGLQ